MSTVHVTPTSDVLAHTETDDCPCIPHTIPCDGGFVTVHNAWDERQDSTEEPQS